MLTILLILLLIAALAGGFGYGRFGAAGWSPAAIIAVILLVMAADGPPVARVRVPAGRGRWRLPSAIDIAYHRGTMTGGGNAQGNTSCDGNGGGGGGGAAGRIVISLPSGRDPSVTGTVSPAGVRTMY